MHQGRCPIADQGGAFDGLTDHAIAHAVGFGAAEHELAVGDVNLPSAKANGIDAVFKAGHDPCGVIGARQHIGVGHARHWNMCKTFAPPVAGGGHAHQPRVLAVLHVTHKSAVFDQGVFGRRCAFVIHRNAAAPVWNRAVIQHGDTGRCNHLAHQASEGRGFLAVEIAFQAVANRFVQQNAGPAGAKHHIEHASGGWHGIKVDQSYAQRLAQQGLPVFGLQQPRQPIPPAAARAPLFAFAMRLDNHRHIHPRHRADIGKTQAFGAQNFDLLQACRKGGRYLHHARIKRASEGVDLFQQVDLHCKCGVSHRIGVAIKFDIGAGRCGCHHPTTSPHRQPCCLRRADKRGFGYFGGMGIARHFAAHSPQTEPFGRIIAGVLDAAIIQHNRL